MPSAIRGGSVTGPYLSSFLGAYQQGRQFAEQQRERELNEGLTALKLSDFLRQREEESGTREAAMAIWRARRGTGSVAGIPTAVGATPSVTGSPAISPFGPVPSQRLSAAAPITTQPSVEELIGGLPVEQQAQLVTTPSGRAMVQSLEAAEQKADERKRRTEAETLLTQAGDHMKAGNALGWIDTTAAALRRLGDVGAATNLQQFGLKMRQDQEERTKANEDFSALSACQTGWESDPGSPEAFACIWDTLGSAKSTTMHGLRLKLAENALEKRLTPIEPINRLYRDIGQRLTPKLVAGQGITEADQRQAWQAALAHPANAAAQGPLLRDLVTNQKGPGFVYDLFGMPRPPETGGPQDAALFIARRVAKQKFQEDDPEYWPYAMQLYVQIKEQSKEVDSLDQEYKALRNKLAKKRLLDEDDLQASTLLLQRVGSQLERLLTQEGAPEDDPRVQKLREAERHLTSQIQQGIRGKQPAPVAPTRPPAVTPAPAPESRATERSRVAAGLEQRGYTERTFGALPKEEQQRIVNEIRSGAPAPARGGPLGTPTPTTPRPALAPRTPALAPSPTGRVEVGPVRPIERPAAARPAPTPAAVPAEPGEVFEEEMVFADRSGKRWSLRPGTRPPAGAQVLGTLEEFLQGEGVTAPPPPWGGKPGPSTATPKPKPAGPKPAQPPASRTTPAKPASAAIRAEADRLLREKVASGELNKIYSSIDQLPAFDREQLLTEAEARLRKRTK